MKDQPSGKGLIRWLWRGYLSRHLGIIVFAVILMAVEGAMLGLLSWIIKPMFDQVFVAGDRAAIVWVATGVFGIFVVPLFAPQERENWVDGSLCGLL